MSDPIPKTPNDQFQIEPPSITLSIKTSSPTISLSNIEGPFTIQLTVKIQYHARITVHTFGNIFRTVASDGKGVEDFLDFIAITPLHNDVLASDPLRKNGDPEQAVVKKLEDEKPIMLFWGQADQFIHLDPAAPISFKLKLGPWPVIKQPSTPRGKDKDGRWVWDAPAVPEEKKWDWGIIGELEEGVEYEVRLREGMYVKWWRIGIKDDFLKIYYSYGGWLVDWALLGKPPVGEGSRMWGREKVLDESKWIRLEVEQGGQDARFRVVS